MGEKNAPHNIALTATMTMANRIVVVLARCDCVGNAIVCYSLVLVGVVPVVSPYNI